MLGVHAPTLVETSSYTVFGCRGPTVWGSLGLLLSAGTAGVCSSCVALSRSSTAGIPDDAQQTFVSLAACPKSDPQLFTLAPTSLRAVRITRASPPGRYMGSNYAFFGITMDTRPGPPTREHPHHIHSLEQLLPSAGPEEPLRSISLPAWVAKGVRSGNVQPKFGMCQGQTWWES